MELNRKGRFYSRILQCGRETVEAGRETELNATETKTEFLSSGVIYLKNTKGGWDWGLINVIRPSVFANWCLLKLVSYPLT